MADTRSQHKAQNWIVQKWLPEEYKCNFETMKLELIWGGSFEFDAVNTRKKIAVCISTSKHKTASGKNAIGKYQKIKSDALYLMFVRGIKKRVLIFTEYGMAKHFIDEQKNGRFPGNIEVRHVKLPSYHRKKVIESRRNASLEVAPVKK